MKMKGRLLVIDDERIVLESCRRIFSEEGVEIATASSGEEGLALARTGAYDLVVTDLKMPHLGGMEILKTLRSERPGLPVVVFTGYADNDTAREALGNGAVEFLAKPFTPEELVSLIDRVLEGGTASQKP
jgi:DNA-binding NtrC family response regulator